MQTPILRLLPLALVLPLSACREQALESQAAAAPAMAGPDGDAVAGPGGDGAAAAEGGAYAKPSAEELRARLTDEQFRVTQQCGTEPPFQNAYWDNKEPGIYVDVVTGEPLFSSLHKFDSHSGWPSFWQPLSEESLEQRSDRTLRQERIEVRSKKGDSHLGHVFDDAPQTPTGLRYCINSAALRFIPVADLEKEGYGEYVSMFEAPKR